MLAILLMHYYSNIKQEDIVNKTFKMPLCNYVEFQRQVIISQRYFTFNH